MFKKILCLLLASFIILGCCACGEPTTDSQDGSQTSQQNGTSAPSPTDKSTSGGSDNSTDNSDNSEKTERITLGGEKPYKIIYETGYSSKASILLEYLSDFDKSSSYVMSSDTTKDDGSCEILIGLTNREESSQAKSSLTSYLDFSVLVSGKKIAIYANTTERIEAAIDWFADSISLDSESKIAYTTATSYVDVYKSYAYPNLSIANEPINSFSIIIPHNATKEEKNTASRLAAWIAENSGFMPAIRYDSTPATSNEIIIGRADREECRYNNSESSEKILYSATVESGKLLLYADSTENYDLALKAFTDGVRLSGGILTKLNVKVLDDEENSGDSGDNNGDVGNEDNTDDGSTEEPTPDVPVTPTPTPTPDPTPDTTPKKAIFIGNSFIYWGGCVTYLSNDDSNESIRKAGGDKGYFNEICKANGINIDVYNYTYGGKNLEWIYKYKLKNLQSSFLNDIDYVFISEAGENNSSFKSTVTKVAELFQNAEEVVYLTHEYTYSSNLTYIKNALPDLASKGYKIVAWGELVNDVYNSKVSVPGAKLSYNKNTFIKNASASEKMNSNAAVISLSGYGDSFHQNPLSGYITAQMCFSAITGISAVGQKYNFCWDKTIAPQYDLQNFLTYQYGKNQTSNFIEVFNSPSDMLGLQKLMDQYIQKYN